MSKDPKNMTMGEIAEFVQKIKEDGGVAVAAHDALLEIGTALGDIVPLLESLLKHAGPSASSKPADVVVNVSPTPVHFHPPKPDEKPAKWRVDMPDGRSMTVTRL